VTLYASCHLTASLVIPIPTMPPTKRSQVQNKQISGLAAVRALKKENRVPDTAAEVQFTIGVLSDQSDLANLYSFRQAFWANRAI
jgi:hypothetical protein